MNSALTHASRFVLHRDKQEFSRSNLTKKVRLACTKQCDRQHQWSSTTNDLEGSKKSGEHLLATLVQLVEKNGGVFFFRVFNEDGWLELFVSVSKSMLLNSFFSTASGGFTVIEREQQDPQCSRAT